MTTITWNTWNTVSRPLALLFALLLLLPATPALAKGQEKVAICHLDENGNYVVIEVAEPALQAHLAHGDLVVGEEVDENCHPLVQDTDKDGIADSDDNCADIANADQLDRYGSEIGSEAGDACEDLDNDGVLDVNEEHFCLYIDGQKIIQSGSASCTQTDGTGNVTVANGATAKASTFNGDNNTAIAVAIGFEAEASTGNGDNNLAIAIAIGGNATADTGNGDNRVASAISCTPTTNVYGCIP